MHSDYSPPILFLSLFVPFNPTPTLLVTVPDSCLLVLFWYLCSLTRAVCINPALELSIGAGVGVWGASVYIQLKAHFLTLAISNRRSTVRDRAPWPPPPSLLGCCWAHYFFFFFTDPVQSYAVVGRLWLHVQKIASCSPFPCLWLIYSSPHPIQQCSLS